MDMGTFRGITTLLIMVAFIGVVIWAYSKRRKKDFDEAANLPFADDEEYNSRDDRHSNNDSKSRHDKGDRNT